jgi:hypothetical protein
MILSFKAKLLVLVLCLTSLYVFIRVVFSNENVLVETSHAIIINICTYF